MHRFLKKIENNKIVPIRENFSEFINLIKNFTEFVSNSIKSPLKLAEMMANRARLLKDVLTKTLNDKESSLYTQYKVFQNSLIHDITTDEFADIYAQTIAFGMFIARFHDDTLEDFSREEARKLIPTSHPFLKGLFKYISDDEEVDSRIIWIIDSLAELFLATNIRELFENKQDPVIHFYETFLSKYNPKIRKSRGVWYSPKEVVDFIIKSVDEVLKNEFKLEGLIDESKITIKVPTGEYTKSGKEKLKQKEVHKVQILDPATGTGTFLASVVEFIKNDFFGNWGEYVEKDLIPRLNGFELLMASYAMAHLKMDMVLSDEKYQPKSRLNIYLTNSLEPPHKEYQTLFATYLANESQQADKLKKETPIMVVVGNPPYSGISSNNIEWINKLIDDYKKEDSGEKLKERKHWLNDDYVKFIRLAQHYIEKNKEGIIAFINPHGFLDNPTFRGMRYNLLKTFDKIYILNLHGNARKKETTPNGEKDENVFDIMQGVSINIFVKTTNSKKLAEVYYQDLWGKRVEKYNYLKNNSLNSVKWEKLTPHTPNYFFIPKDETLQKEYNQGFGVNELFVENVTGIVTARDSVVIDISKDELLKRIEKFTDEHLNDEEIRKWLFPNKKDGKYKRGDSRGWKLEEARKKIKNNFHLFNLPQQVLLHHEFLKFLSKCF